MKRGKAVSQGLVRNMQLFALDGSKIEFFETCFCDTVKTYNDHPSFVQHVLARVNMFFTLIGYWRRVHGAPFIGAYVAAFCFSRCSTLIAAVFS